VTLRIFIGRDPRKPLDANVLANSIVEHASVPVSITMLSLKTLPIKRRGLTEFTFSRFLVPYLCGYQGYGLFLDADMVVTGNIAELFKVPKPGDTYQVYVNKNQKPFEWASAMLFDCSMCEVLTPEFIDNPKNPLMDFKWCESTGVGSFHEEWNWCVPYSGTNENAKLYHFTQGTPNWRETRGKLEDKYWNDAYKAMIHSVTFKELMGESVHVQHMKVAS
jgi:hypothetical protein